MIIIPSEVVSQGRQVDEVIRIRPIEEIMYWSFGIQMGTMVFTSSNECQGWNEQDVDTSLLYEFSW